MSKGSPKHRQQLLSIEIERRSIMALYEALAKFLVAAKENGWTCDELNANCGETIDACNARMRNLRKIVRMNHGVIADEKEGAVK